MCGIAGIVEPGGSPERATVERMAATLRHRGPDEHGIRIAPEIGLGARRLSIIDLDDREPAAGERGRRRSSVVFNGEIYNYLELRQELLGARPHASHAGRHRGASPHLYEELRRRARRAPARHVRVRHLGRAPQARLVLARDRLGKKPLYYADPRRRARVRLRAQGAARRSGGSRELDPEALARLPAPTGYIPAPRTILRGVHKLEPATIAHARRRRDPRPALLVADATARRRPRPGRARGAGFASSSARPSGCRLVADVPVGAFLSGGMDSSTVLARWPRRRRTGAHVHDRLRGTTTTTSGSEPARSRATSAPSTTSSAPASADPTLLPGLVDAFDEPFGNPTAALVSSLSKVTREHVKVVLTGDGSDELFFGYPRFRGLWLAERYRRLAPGALRDVAASLAGRMSEDTVGRHTRRRVREFLEAGGGDTRGAYLDWIGYFLPPMLGELLEPALRDEIGQATDFLGRLLGDHPDLNRISQTELQSFLPCNVLEYADKMSMAHGLELRAPFADHRLVEYVGTMPASVKIRHGRQKWALREALRDDLPAGVLRRRKRGLNPPLGSWLTEGRGLVDDLLSPRSVRARGLFEPRAVDALRAEHAAGRRDRSLHIWALMVLEMWFRRRVDV